MFDNFCAQSCLATLAGKRVQHGLLVTPTVIDGDELRRTSLVRAHHIVGRFGVLLLTILVKLRTRIIYFGRQAYVEGPNLEIYRFRCEQLLAPQFVDVALTGANPFPTCNVTGVHFI